MSERKPLTDEQLDDIWKEMLKPETKKPIHLDRSAWEPCAECQSCDNCKNNSDYNPDEGIYGECGRCHKYSNFEPRSFCGECGRPLTDAAWDMLEKRLEGAK